jgi:hypothetical protein
MPMLIESGQHIYCHHINEIQSVKVINTNSVKRGENDPSKLVRGGRGGANFLHFLDDLDFL